MKRENYLSWKQYFIELTKLIAKRSKDPVLQVGSIIINPKNNTIVATGYNGLPRGCSDDEFPWGNNKENGGWLNTKYPYVVHAEANALIHAQQNCDGFEMYSTLFPCNECAKLIIQIGIKKVYYLEVFDKGFWEESFKATKRMFGSAGVYSEKIIYQKDNN
jgi:dCMP deaminase